MINYLPDEDPFRVKDYNKGRRFERKYILGKLATLLREFDDLAELHLFIRKIKAEPIGLLDEPSKLEEPDT